MDITQAERDAVYKVILSRRDVRGEFRPDPVPDEVLMRVLAAAHHAPSVGFMQPWDFIVVKNAKTKQSIRRAFEVAHAEAADMFDEDRREQYQSFKLEGIVESPVGICVTCDRSRHGPVVIGRTAIPEMDLFSSVCAVQNLWLAARAENLGLGWVSIIHNEALRDLLEIPEHIVPIAYLCMGYVSFFHEKPELEKAGWLAREELKSLIHHEHWTSGD
ncbi:MAG: 5,6-dimethylbenzimidazole synthase [Kiritimatiellia bacterium]|jgi:5,6-dimethylbenzimidazole synthase|nr:5,6-dimethylbenzimidazole synthase [Kiritimatiellia bacterium]MDP6809845.1 5,6-dimethylbenzimidazole synthase [Kiritimatiellia bacterium]MDP7024237.1 5,6-dimethylbenzimidazole synthase [Kiritimatiellia bacterium]